MDQSVNLKVSGPCWKGFLASLIVLGAGQFFQGRRERAAFAFLIAGSLIPILLLILLVPLVPLILVYLFLPIGWMMSLYFLIDAWRPTPTIGWRRWAILIVIAVAVYNGEKFGFLSVCRIYSIPTDSMSPTIRKGDLIVSLRDAYGFRSPQRGDIVAFPCPNSLGQDLITEKRLVGLPGDVLNLKNGVLSVNDAPISYPGQIINYSPAAIITSDAALSEDRPFSVPEGQIFVLGDNSLSSFDSRYFGTIPLNSLKGEITVILWPINRVQRIKN